jgi:hypothetical protein
MLQAFLCTGQNETVAANLRDLLEEGRLFETTADTDGATALDDPAVAGDFDLFVVYGSPFGLTDTAWANVRESIATGAGVVLVGTGANVDALDPTVPPSPFEVATTRIAYIDHQHPITRGLRDFDAPVATIPVPDATLSRLAVYGSPADAALAVGKYGRGHLAVFGIGIDVAASPSASLASQPLRRLMARTAEWACSGNVLDF